MSVGITPYTETSAVVTSLGLDSNDCPDAVFVDSKMDVQLLVELDQWLPTHKAVFDTGAGSGASVAEKLNRNYLTLYAQFFCAVQIAKRPMQFIQTHGDGKAEMSRFKEALENTRGSVTSEMLKYQNLLNAAVNGVSGDSSNIAVVGLSIPSADPVTGDGLI